MVRRAHAGSAWVANYYIALDTAIQMGCKLVRLDTLAEMQMAQSLYAREGFERIDLYYNTPVSGTTFMQCDLKAWSTQNTAVL